MDNLKVPRGYAEDFDPDWYLENYVKTLKEQIGNTGIHPFALDSLHDIFSAGKYSGEKLLDIGTGPSVLSVISASRHVQEIHLSDINARCREILHTWLKGTENCKEIFEYVCEKEQEGQTSEKRSEEVRKKVTNILEVDLRDPEPIKNAEGSYDIITASLLFAAIAMTEDDYTALLKKVMSLLKPKGYLVVVDVLNSPFYKVGDFKFSNPRIEGKKMKGLFLGANFDILDWKETIRENYIPVYAGSASNEKGCFTMICQKE